MTAPPPTERLRFREMLDADLDLVAAMLGDPEVMRHYPRPKTREEAAAWIAWSRNGYAEHGHGLWVIEDHDGVFVGDCGLTWQQVEGRRRLEVGYHVVRSAQGRGLATEAARACVAHAFDVLGAGEVIAIVHPANLPSARVAAKLGMLVERTTASASGTPIVVHRVGHPDGLTRV